MSHNQFNLLDNAVAILGTDSYRNMIELGFSLKSSLECEEFQLSHVLREISTKIDEHIGSWGTTCGFKILTNQGKGFIIAGYRDGEEKFRIPVSYEQVVVLSKQPH